ncbi:hypothetical protein N6G96_09640 [Pediococcus inopinatus]|uniref:Teichoic acid polysaccharide export protein n=2 Tax=Pediococcus inopinatus TaxID=114090 RepID=A0ABZ0Q4K3_9LACO|nr:hypothetical protein [Pediococcus inopinatus]WPC21513.1 hypothetical protein N6G96_09640 [Pediococcus inopinatus]
MAKRNMRNKIYFGFLFLFFACFRYFLILCSDDFFWAGDKGQYLLHHFFVGDSSFGGSGNGRYLGSILEIYSVRHLIVGVLAYGIFLTLLIYLIYKICGSNNISLILATLAILFMPTGVFTDVIAWNAAFVNYVPPMVTSLAFLWVNKQGIRANFVIDIFLLVLMFCGQLFLESMTVYQLLMIIAVMVFQKYILKSKVRKYNYFAFAGSVMGTMLMVLNPSYHMISNSSYRQTSHSILQILHNYVFQTHFYFLTFNFLLNVLIAFLFIMILLSKKDIRFRKTIIVILIAYLAYFICINKYIDYKTVSFLFTVNGLNKSIAYMDAYVMTSFWVVLLALILYILPKNIKGIAIFCQISGGITAGPYLIVASPLRVREYFGNYIFMVMVAILIANYAVQVTFKNTNFNFSKLNFISFLLVGLVSMNLLLIMGINHHANSVRASDKTWLNTNKVLTTHVPFRKYVKNLDILSGQTKFYYQNRSNMDFVQKILH